MRRVLVTGANGFIGHHLCRALAAGGDRVVALAHRGTGRLDALVSALGGDAAAPAPGDVAPGAAGALVVCRGDLLDPASLEAAFAAHGPVDAVAHLATEPPGDGPRAGANTEGTRRLLAAAAAHDVPRLVYTSTMSVFDFLDPDLALPLAEAAPTAPRDAYGSEKLAAEQLCLQAARTAALEVVVLRLAGVYGPGKSGGAVHAFLQAARRGTAVDIAANRRVDLLWVEDAVDAVRRGLDPGAAPGTYHVGSGVAVALDEVARQAAAAVGVAGVEVRVHGPGNAFCLDIDRTRRGLGFAPTPLAEALRRFARHLDAKGNRP